MMTALRYLYVLALVVWLGGMLIIGGVVAPSTFQVLHDRGPAFGRAAAGAVVGEILRRFALVSYVAGATLLVTLAAMAALGPPPLRFRPRLAIVVVMLAIAVYSGVFLTARIERLQREIGAPVSTLAEGDARRVRFGQLHARSTWLMLINIIGGLALVYWEAKGES